MVRLRSAEEPDLDFIVAQEARQAFAQFILRWGRTRHLKNLSDPDKRYLIAERGGEPLGYVILAGLRSEHRAIELVRIVAAEPGQGLGQEILMGVLKLAFDKLGAHRLWLDVFPDNERARRAYRKTGFQEDGILREAIRHGGSYRSLVIMSLLASEYREIAGRR